MLKYSPTFVTVFLALFNTTNAFAQKPNAPRPGRMVTVQESFDPAFRIEPLSHQINGRVGDEVAFKFTLVATDRAANIEIVPMGLRQELSGLIMHDESGTASDVVRLFTPRNVTLQPNQPMAIEGMVRIPRGEAKFYSFGLLVKDIGEAANLSPTIQDGKRKTQAGIRFVTQYVLRLDVHVENARGEGERELDIEQVKMVAHEGRPRLQAIVRNPSDTAFEFELRARLRSAPTDRSMKPLHLVMPIRESMENEERYVARILPKSRIRMEEMLPEAIAGGNYECELEMLVEGRTIMKKSLSVPVNAQDYPAQEVLIAQVGESLQVSPAQVELSQVRGGTRRISLLLKNTSKFEKTVEIDAKGESGFDLSSVLVQPKEVSIAPGGSRKVSVMLQYQKDVQDASLYGKLAISSKSDKQEFVETRDLPLAVVLKKVASPEVDLSGFTITPYENYTAIHAKVTNNGTVHLPLDARLTISGEKGRREVLVGGFGRWLMPGKSDRLEFRLDHALAVDKYNFKCELKVDDKIVTEEKRLELTDSENAVNPTAATLLPVSN